MVAPSGFYLIVGLGNPGIAYTNTRHNIGFCALDILASKQGLAFQRAKNLHGMVAQGVIREKKVILLKPETYMNSSGESVKACISYYGMPLEQVCVVSDDIYLPVGRIKMNPFGGDGGHNGFRSISTHLGTQGYPRLRVGVGDHGEGDLADYVLAPFNEEERKEIPNLLHRACEALECWLGEGITKAMQLANACQEKK